MGGVASARASRIGWGTACHSSNSIDAVELNRSTGELREALQIICTFANSGGRVFIELAAARDRFEPIVFDVARIDAT